MLQEWHDSILPLLFKWEEDSNASRSGWLMEITLSVIQQPKWESQEEVVKYIWAYDFNMLFFKFFGQFKEIF